MYTAPPGPDDETENRPTTDDARVADTTRDATDAPADADAPSPDIEPTTGATDANWTGTVSADD